MLFEGARTRSEHTARLLDLLHLCLLRRDFSRARRIWALLARDSPPAALRTPALVPVVPSRRPAALRAYVRLATDRVDALRRYVLELVSAGSYAAAYEALDTFLPSLPYNDAPELHMYAAFLSLSLGVSASNPDDEDDDGEDNIDMSSHHQWHNSARRAEAQAHLRRAMQLDPSDPLIRESMKLVRCFISLCE